MSVINLSLHLIDYKDNYIQSMSSSHTLIDPAGNLKTTIDYTDVVENIDNKATSAQNDKLNKITNIIAVLTGLTDELKKTNHLK